MREKYTEEEYVIIRLSDGAFIPRDLGNQDYLIYLDQKKKEEGISD